MKIVNRSLNELPKYQTKGSAGMDLMSNEKVVILPMDRYLVGTGLFIQIPFGHEGQVRARSGNAIKHGITLINAVGTIDEDYTGEIKIPLVNLGSIPFEVNIGDRIAQLIISRYEKIEFEEVCEIEKTERIGGFGHTGK